MWEELVSKVGHRDQLVICYNHAYLKTLSLSLIYLPIYLFIYSFTYLFKVHADSINRYDPATVY